MTGAIVIAGGVVLGALAGAGCTVDTPAPVPLPVGDLAVFVAQAQPALDRRCAAPGCHADGARPFAVFSPGRRRLDPARLHLLEPLTAAELTANARAIAALALEPLLAGEPVSACPVLCKPLALAAGGCGHVVGPVFAGPDDRDYVGLAAYLETLALPEPP